MVEVYNRLQIERYVCDEPHVVIVLHDPDKGVPMLPVNKHRLGNISIACFDIDTYMDDAKAKEMKAFERYHAQQIAWMIQVFQKKSRRWIVSCEAGQNRSAGVAGALCVCVGLSDEQFFKRPYTPNMRIYRLVLDEWSRSCDT